MSGTPVPKRGSLKTKDIPWLARLTHPLVFFGAALALFEGTIGTALLLQHHSDTTVIWLCAMMAVVILSAIVTVAILVVKRPQGLMLTQQDAIGEDIDVTRRARDAARILVETPKPRTPAELLQLLERIERTLSGTEDD